MTDSFLKRRRGRPPKKRPVSHEGMIREKGNIALAGDIGERLTPHMHNQVKRHMTGIMSALKKLGLLTRSRGFETCFRCGNVFIFNPVNFPILKEKAHATVPQNECVCRECLESQKNA